jgi:hypothetical protein
VLEDLLTEWALRRYGLINSHTPSGAIQGVGHGMLKGGVDSKEIAVAKGYGRGLPEGGEISQSAAI